MMLNTSPTPQLDLLARPSLEPRQVLNMQREIRNQYWHIRQLRGGKFTQARLRQCYRRVEKLKRELQLAGVEKRDLLDFLACCRCQCSATKQPFLPCRFCS